MRMSGARECPQVRLYSCFEVPGHDVGGKWISYQMDNDGNSAEDQLGMAAFELELVTSWRIS
jgi:hypothetical protein